VTFLSKDNNKDDENVTLDWSAKSLPRCCINFFVSVFVVSDFIASTMEYSVSDLQLILLFL
jgi:hypothetical protein